MNTRAQGLALCAILTALALLCLYLASVFPAMQAVFLVLAAAVTAVVLIESGMRYGILCYLSVSLLALFLLPNRLTALFYAIYFGWYPLVKSKLEQDGKRAKIYLKKGIFFSALSFLVFVLFREQAGQLSANIMQIFARFLPENAHYFQDTMAVFFLLLLAFCLLDFILSRMIGFYLGKIYNKKDGGLL